MGKKTPSSHIKESYLTIWKRSGTTVAKDLDADEMGTITDGDAAVDEASFIPTVTH